ncbi:MAG: translocation/assembly module TamB domain-containing protein [Treponema sp.]|nr:translocation/assembly module TamB domain-containing protein [Treponema sp.]
MKKIPVAVKISVLVFFIVLVLAFAFSRPLYNRIRERVDKTALTLTGKVTELTGLTLTYESFSPSILSFLSVKGIKLVDENGVQLLSIKNARINYKLKELIKGNMEDFIRSVLISGVDVDLAQLIGISDRLAFLKADEDNAGKNQVDLDTIMSYVPQDITVKNISLNYGNESFDSSFVIKDISLLNSSWGNSIDFQMDCAANALVKKDNKKYSGSVYLTGSVSEEFDKATLYLNVSDFTDGNIRIAKTNLMATYEDKTIDVHTIQSVNPFSIKASYNLETQKASVAIDTEKLNPLSVVSMSGKSELTKKLKDMQFTTSVEAELDTAVLSELSKGKKASNFVSYKSKGSFNVPSSLFPGGAVVSYSLNGNDKKINLTSIKADGKKILVDGGLSFGFKNMQLSGNVNLSKYVLPNGCEISTEVFFDPLNSGFMIFSPQVFLGEKALTAIQAKVLPQKDSVDFEFELSDYYCYDSGEYENPGEPGVISMSGSYLLSSKFMQTGISMNSIYVRSVLELLQEMADKSKKEQLAKAMQAVTPYMFTGDLYLSTDFSSVSYNLPYLVLANTQKDNQLLFISVNGNEQNVNLDRFDLIFGKFALNASAGVDFMPGGKNMTFYVDMTTSSIPYRFQGAISPEAVKVAGDYGTDIEVRFGKNKEISGYTMIENFPVVYEKLSLILSTNTTFAYSQQNGPEIHIERFEVEETDASSAYNPKLTLSGNGTKYGMQLNSISYTDLYSTLQGQADVTVNINDGLFDSVGLNASLKDSSGSGEGVIFDGIVSNPDRQQLNKDNILNTLYISALTEINNFSLNRFMAVKNSNNEVTATLSLSGTLEHPYVMVNVDKLSFLLANEIVYAGGVVTLEDNELTIDNFAVNQSVWSVKNIAGNVSLKDFTGGMEAVFETKGKQFISIPMALSIKDSYVAEGKKLPDNMMIQLSSSGMGGSLVKKSAPFDITALYSSDFVSFYSSDNLGLTGTYTFSDGLYANINADEKFSCGITGTFKDNDLDMYFSNITVNLPVLLDCLALDEMFAMSKGVLEGNLAMTGTYDTPEFDGSLSIDKPSFKLPSVFKEPVSTDQIVLTAKSNEFELVESIYSIGKKQIFKLGSKVYLNKWVLDQFDVALSTLNKRYLPLKFTNPYVDVAGDVSCDLNINMSDSILTLAGSIYGDKLDIESALQNISKTSFEPVDSSKEIFIKTDLDLTLGNHISLNFNPLLRCVFVPNTKLKIALDSITKSYVVDGKLSLKSGDVAYLNRSFYIKEGSIKFNPQEIANPKVTLKAETRERDSNNQNIRIILTAENQDLLDFKPRFSSVPAKSENEIMSLIGQVVIADLNEIEKGSDVIPVILSTAGDYALQSFATRQIENKLRESLNFDIFSIRTNIIQNTMSYVRSNQANNNNNTIWLGNFFDNSTVYIGKYLSSAIYVDAMLNLSVGENIANFTDAREKGFILQPEIGFEFEVPFTNVNWRNIQDMDASFRVGMAMDATFQNKDFNYLFNPSFTMSLLWRF